MSNNRKTINGINGAVAAGVVETLATGPYRVYAVQVLAYAAMTVEGTIDGTTWYPIAGVAADGTAAATITALGLFKYNIAGYARIRTRQTAAGTSSIKSVLSTGA